MNDIACGRCNHFKPFYGLLLAATSKKQTRPPTRSTSLQLNDFEQHIRIMHFQMLVSYHEFLFTRILPFSQAEDDGLSRAAPRLMHVLCC